MKVLIQCGDHYENIKRIYSLAKNLKIAGCKPIVLVYSETSEIFFLSKGIDAISLNMKKIKLISKLKIKIYKVEHHNNISLADVLDCDIKKNPSIYSAKRKHGTKLNAIKHLNRIDEIIRYVSPDAICIWNGFTGLVANSLRLIAEKRQISCFFLERGLYKDSLFIDQQGVNGFSYLSSINSNDIGLSTKRKEIKLVNRKVFVPLQVQSDTNIIYNSPFLSMRDFILNIYDIYTCLGVEIIVRPHPEEVHNDLNLPTLPGVIYTSDNTVDYWIDHTDATITINSTVGLESIIRGKPTFAFGRSIYSGKIASIDVKSGIDIVNVIKNNFFETISGAELLEYIEQHHILTKEKTCSTFNKILSAPPQYVLNLNESYNHLNISPLEYSKRCNLLFANLAKKVTRKSKVHIYTDLSHSDTLNLTYRKTSESITVEYIRKGLSEFLNRKLDPKNIVISRTEGYIDDGINVFISKSSKVKNLKHWDVVIDRYFNIILT
ncbi:hypothetical protein [Aeromonas veronii]|uniref:capsular polysaccharide export protein, LipB/KpsS family n=1 Tax=Aeromonas veronii TaxID=654 RepID=UPI000DE5844C|nr:hypothetical protein [Aeromonas veronii]